MGFRLGIGPVHGTTVPFGFSWKTTGEKREKGLEKAGLELHPRQGNLGIILGGIRSSCCKFLPGIFPFHAHSREKTPPTLRTFPAHPRSGSSQFPRGTSHGSHGSHPMDPIPSHGFELFPFIPVPPSPGAGLSPHPIPWQFQSVSLPGSLELSKWDHGMSFLERDEL